jgi:hypothetical protein
MASVIELHECFTKGKVTRKTKPLPPEEMPKPEKVVTLVAPDSIESFLGAHNRAEVTQHLRKLRDSGLLITDKGARLTQSIKGQPIKRAYCFGTSAETVPRIDHRESRSGNRPTGSASGVVRKILEV